MIDASRILDLLVGGQQPGGQVPAPLEAAQQPSAGGNLLERARSMLGGVPSGLGGGLAGGVAAGAITSLLLGSKGGREFAGEALKLGAAAALGGLAYRAYTNYRGGAPVGSQSPAARHPVAAGASGAASVPAIPAARAAATPSNEHALLLVRAMIAAAMADGTLDPTERQAIIGRLPTAGIGAEEQRFLDEEIARPLSPAQLAAAAASPGQRAEVYLAAALAIDADTSAERAYLHYLATTLELDDKLIAHLEDAVRQAKGTPALAPPDRRLAG